MGVRRRVTWMRYRAGRSEVRGLVFSCVGRLQLSSCNLVYFVVWDGVGTWHEAGQALFGIALESILYIGHYRVGTCMNQTARISREEHRRGID